MANYKPASGSCVIPQSSLLVQYCTVSLQLCRVAQVINAKLKLRHQDATLMLYQHVQINTECGAMQERLAVE